MDIFDKWKEFWIIRLSLNLAGYSIIISFGYLIINFIKIRGYFKGFIFIHFCFLFQNFLFTIHVYLPLDSSIIFKQLELFSVGGENFVDNQSIGKFKVDNKSSICILYGWLFFYTIILHTSYLLYGFYQEKIMTKLYKSDNGINQNYFTNSQFLVFTNRIFALVLASLICLFTEQPKQYVPYYKYSFASFSNIMSSWFQYEALKYVSFPLQVIAKLSKFLPMLVMSKIIGKKKIEMFDFLSSFFILIGIFLFVFSSKDAFQIDSIQTTYSGLTLLFGYLMFDSFTPIWQNDLSEKYHMSKYQLMVGINSFSVLFTSVSLCLQDGFLEAFQFMMAYKQFAFDILILSICSAISQISIVKTVTEFGPVVFIIITLIRQICAMLLSCFLYGHQLTLLSYIGVAIVSLASLPRLLKIQTLNNKTDKFESSNIYKI